MDYNAFLNKTLDINDLPLKWRELVQEALEQWLKEYG